MLCTTAQVASLVSSVADDRADIVVLIQGESDPHSYQLVKGDDEKFRRAEVIFYSGLGLEHSPAITRLMAKKEKLSIGDSIKLQRPELLITYANLPDPHIWMDVSLWKLGVKDIADLFSRLRPEYAKEFQERAKAEEEHLEKVHDQIKTLCQSIPDAYRYLVTTHDAFNYFTRAYLAIDDERQMNTWQPRCFAPEGLAPEAQISTQDIEKTVNHILKYNIHWIFSESNISQESIQRVVEVLKRKGHTVEIATTALYGDAMGSSDSVGCTYEGMMLFNAETITKFLRESGNGSSY